MVVASPLAVFAFAWDDVVDFDVFRELFTVGALIPGFFFLEVRFGVCPSVVACVGAAAGSGAPCFLASCQFLVAQFAAVGVTGVGCDITGHWHASF